MKKLRSFLFATLSITAVFAPVMSATANPHGYIVTYYYSDAALTQNIGVLVTYCNGEHIIANGSTSGYTKKFYNC